MEAYRMAKKKRNPANAAAIAHIFENYEIKSVLDIQEALKDMFGGKSAERGDDRHGKKTIAKQLLQRRIAQIQNRRQD